MIQRRLCAILLAFLALSASPAAAQQQVQVPYWASLRVDEVNMRVGPGEDYAISWVYRRAQLPLKVLRLRDGWRLVQDPGGMQGWMLARFLTRNRGAIVRGQALVDMRESGDAAAKLLWRLEPGVTGMLGSCDGGWCSFTTGARHGYVPQARLWGAGEP